MLDEFDLQRFVQAQQPIYEQARSELQAARKRSHWMWFVFPQLRGLGRSEMAYRYGIAARGEAQAYLAHPLLGPRLNECTALVNGIEGSTARQIFGTPDDLKFRSSMTLFAAVAWGNPIFEQALERYYAGKPDAATLDLLAP